MLISVLLANNELNCLNTSHRRVVFVRVLTEATKGRLLPFQQALPSPSTGPYVLFAVSPASAEQDIRCWTGCCRRYCVNHHLAASQAPRPVWLVGLVSIAPSVPARSVIAIISIHPAVHPVPIVPIIGPYHCQVQLAKASLRERVACIFQS